MRLKPKHAWFLAFTAVFAALAGFVFWGTWSLDFAPVMPDCPIVHSPWWFEDWWRNWVQNGKFVPGDVRIFLGSPYHWQELQYALAMYFAALGAAYFLRGRGLSRLASYGGGLLLAFSGYWCSLFSAGHHGWFQWMTYGVFAFGLADRAVRKNKLKNWLLLGAALAWGSFYQPDLWLLFTVLTAAYFVFICFRERKIPAWKGMTAAFFVFLLIGSPSFYNAFFKDLAGRDRQIAEGQTVGGAAADGVDKRWIFTTNWSLPPSEVSEFFIPRINGDTSCMMTLMAGEKHGSAVRPYTGALGRPYGSEAGNYRQHSLYVGRVTCLLALAGIIGAFMRKERTAVFFFVCGVVFCVFSFGRYCEIVYRCVYALPFGDYLRAPVKWHHLTEFCLVLLAGFGIEFLFRRFNGSKKRFVPIVLGAFVLVGAADLAWHDSLYCAPVNVGEARRQKAGMQMTFVRHADLENPQVREMVRRKQVLLLSDVKRDPVLAGILQPVRKNYKTFPPLSVPAWLGIVSMIASAGVGFIAIKK